MSYITIEDISSQFRNLSIEEQARAEALIPIVCDTLKQEAYNRNRDLDLMIEEGKLMPNVLKSVCVDIVARALLTSTTTEPMTNVSQSALGYSFSGTFLNPGGGLFIKKSELKRLGLSKQRLSGIDL